ncbi:MAG: hypothetical protein ACR2HK_10640 [Gemmatimonadales bacterium]
MVAILAKPRVGVLAPGIEVRSALRAELEGTVSVRYCDSGDALVEVAAAGGIDAAVLELWGHAQASNLPLISRLQERAPRLRIGLWFAPTPAAFRDAAAALTAGASDCAVRGYDRLSRVIRNMLASQSQPEASLLLLARLEPLVPDDLKEFATACALKASPRLTAATVAGWVRVKERTLRDRCQRAGLCAPSVFIDCAAAVRAACLLDLYGLEPDVVVEAMQFGSTRALSALLREYTGRSARELREHGGFVDLLSDAEAVFQRSLLWRLAPRELDGDLIDRYLTDDLTSEERLRFEQRLVNAPVQLIEFLEQMRHQHGGRSDSPAARRRRKLWARLRRRP